MLSYQNKRQNRHRRIRAKVRGKSEIPRLCVFRSHKHIYAQLIDDEKSKTLLTASDLDLKESSRAKGLKESLPPKKIAGDKKKKAQEPKSKVSEIKRTSKVSLAFDLGKLIAEKALKQKIKKVVFDRGGYLYHGRVKAIADGAREGGLKF